VKAVLLWTDIAKLTNTVIARFGDRCASDSFSRFWRYINLYVCMYQMWSEKVRCSWNMSLRFRTECTVLVSNRVGVSDSPVFEIFTIT